jgi:fermentation-respiration switch protein FrsA (DUF1100 family)
MRKCIPIAAVLAAAAALLAQRATSGAQVAVFRSTADDSTQQYAFWLPANLEAGKKYPLLISLHAEESSHRLNLRQIFGILPRFGQMDSEDLSYLPVQRDPGYLIACPLARGSMGYQGIAEQDVYDVIADVQRRYPVDPDRIFLTGISMGGGGALWLALTRPDVWAAVAPLCPSPVAGAAELAANASNLPIRLFHGEHDPIVPVAESRNWQRRLLAAGVPVDYLEFPGVRHNVWEPAFRGGALFDWLGKQRRNPFPERVRLVTRSYKYAKAYWVRVDGLTPGLEATVDARRAGPAGVVVDTANVDGFTLTLDKPVSTVTVNGVALKVTPAAGLSFEKVQGKWRAGRFLPAGKRPGLEGPIFEAVAGRHIYVYGTLGAGNDEIAGRRAVAESAAQWSTARTRLNLVHAVKADRDVTAADRDSADLILFGTSETNSLIASAAASLPLALSPAAADYGLLFIAPLGSRYVLISSGLPWWTGADEASRGATGFAPRQARLLATFGDYVLFKGSLNDVVSEGRFDGNWKVPPDASARMRATGTVTVR